MAAIVVPSSNTKQELKGAQLDFNLNINLPPPCTTGYLPPTQRRSPASVDAPDRPAAELYCRVPQDSEFNVRGARNIPCETKPWKRAPTVEMCESDDEYVPLNEGYNWKGDPNATYQRPGSAAVFRRGRSATTTAAGTGLHGPRLVSGRDL